MTDVPTVISRVRLEIGDESRPWRANFRGTGQQAEYDLPVERVNSTGFTAYTIDPNTNVMTTLVEGTDYTLDTDNGIITLTANLALDVVMICEGTAYSLFSDDDLTTFVNEAALQHNNNKYSTVRTRNSSGFIVYDRVPVTLTNMPDIEIPLVAMLASIEAMWALSTDASTDVDIESSEGTRILRTQRFSQLQQQIAMLEDRYINVSMQLGVGLYRIEMSNLRRVSRLTNRLVPVYVEREYDDTEWPVRESPQVDAPFGDWDGPPSPAGNGYY